MSITTSKLKLAYIVHEIKLNKILDDEFVPLDAPVVYITKKPIAMVAKINDASNDSFDLTRVSIIQLPDNQPIKSLYITTTETSTEVIEIITSDFNIFSDIGIENSVSLLDSDGIEYDSRLPKQANAELASQIELRDSNVDTYNLLFEDYSQAVFVVYSSLDDSITVKYYGSVDGVKYHKLGADITLVDGSVTEQFDIQTVSDSWKYIRITVEAPTPPTAGDYTVEYSIKS